MHKFMRSGLPSFESMLIFNLDPIQKEHGRKPSELKVRSTAMYFHPSEENGPYLFGADSFNPLLQNTTF